jgi:hypothetical protein
MNVAGGLGDDVEIVEQPFSRRRRGFLACVLCERRIHLAQRAHVFFEPAQVHTSAAALPGSNRQQRRQSPGVLFEQLDTEQFFGTQRKRTVEFCAPRLSHDSCGLQ